MKSNVYKGMVLKLFIALSVLLVGFSSRPLTDYAIEQALSNIVLSVFWLPVMFIPLLCIFGALLWIMLILFQTRKSLISIDKSGPQQVSTPQLKSLKERNNRILTILYIAFTMLFMYLFIQGFLQEVNQ